MQTDNTPSKRRTLITLVKESNRTVRLILILAAIALVVVGLGRWQYNRKHSNKISRTITQYITEVKKIQEFCTANYTEETVVHVTRKRRLATDELALIVKGTVRVGFDLSKMEAMPTTDTSIVVVLPKPQVLDIVSNPSDCETFAESGKWSMKKVTKYKEVGRLRILEHAKADGIFNYAQENGIERIKLLFMGMGFSDIQVVIAE